MDGRKPYIRISGNKSREIKWWSFQIHISGVKEPTETTDTGLKKYQINAYDGHAILHKTFKI